MSADQSAPGGAPAPERRQLAAVATLLRTVFDADPPIDEALLRWHYDENPAGRASVGQAFDGVVPIGNYALVPGRYRRADDGRELRLGVGVDLAVHPAARGSGAFRRAVEDSYAVGVDDGLDGILGVANAQSAPRMASTLGWRVLDPFPVRLLVPLGRPLRVRRFRADEPGWQGGLALAPSRPTGRFAPVWDLERLRWRLRRPGNGYLVHVHRDLVIVSTASRIGPFPAAVCLKVLRRSGTSPDPVPLGRLGSTLARAHGTPFVLHWGRNDLLRARGGIRLPRRLMPSPLELVLHTFHAGFDRERFELTDFELLDFDAF